MRAQSRALGGTSNLRSRVPAEEGMDQGGDVRLPALEREKMANPS
jgi:hypothetical protein